MPARTNCSGHRCEPCAAGRDRRLDEAEAQHSDIDAALGMVNLARQRWTDVGGNGGRDDLIASLLLFGLLATHLDTEERELLPLAAAH
jgi:hypothetical protein